MYYTSSQNSCYLFVWVNWLGQLSQLTLQYGFIFYHSTETILAKVLLDLISTKPTGDHLPFLVKCRYFANSSSSLKLNALIVMILYPAGSPPLHQIVPFWSYFWSSSTDLQVLVLPKVSHVSKSLSSQLETMLSISTSLTHLTATLYQSAFG